MRLLATMFAMVVLLSGLMFSGTAAAEDSVFVEDGVAIRGYDPVAYFTAGKPVKGKAEYQYTHNGAVWQFASAENLATFKSDPEHYTPQYGGYCAYGMSKGYAVETQPDAFAVVDGKLYLNYNTGVLKTWKKDPQGYIVVADKNWGDMFGE